MDITKVLIYVYVIFFIGAGVNHFLNPQFYDAIVPQFIPFPRLVHQITGVLEIIIPLFLLTRFRKEAALIMIIFLILIYGANLYVWVNNLPYGRTYFSNQQHFIRLLLQILYIYITYVIYMYDK
ncbi:hypothetical protein GYB13_03985 [bacterium]|nr:hypothetical protein [bacterium]GIS05230.1 MAG: hypothetical protein CM15mP108_3340 [Gammaproteobacteria bacterium]